ncbi:SMI1/KNR4 family protein [Paenibacillus sp. TAF58]
MMWKEFVTKCSDRCEFVTPTLHEQLSLAEKELAVILNDDLKDLLLETNGIKGEYGIDIIWSIDRILKDNITFRTFEEFKELYMPFDHLLFFSDAGNGDQFAFPILNGKMENDNIFVWNHEDDSRMWIASSLKNFIKGWLDGTISV